MISQLDIPIASLLDILLYLFIKNRIPENGTASHFFLVIVRRKHSEEINNIVELVSYIL